jgi:hypothetical protein
MNANLIIKRVGGIAISGDKISGNTFSVKDYIKSYLGGKWDSNSKSWIVDTKKVEDLIAKKCIQIDENAQPEKAQNGSRATNGWCNKCHSYCWGDCDA